MYYLVVFSPHLTNKEEHLLVIDALPHFVQASTGSCSHELQFTHSVYMINTSSCLLLYLWLSATTYITEGKMKTIYVILIIGMALCYQRD